jgi:Transcriptional Coactivator p15 (PC4)
MNRNPRQSWRGPEVQSDDLDSAAHSTDRTPPARHCNRKTDRTREPRPAVLADAITIAEWKMNRRGESIKIQIKPFEGAVLVDLRTWYGEDGHRKPGKGLAATVKHLPALAAALREAENKARELGLLDDGGSQ